MVFSSIVFIFRFLPAAFITYYFTPHKYKNLVTVILSLIFYSWGEGKYFLLMIASILVDYMAGIMIYKYKNNKKKGMIILCLSLMFNLGMLFIFKYLNFFIESINRILNLSINTVNIHLPLGISFYTFQTMSYSIDVFRGTVKPEKNIINFAVFVTLFPQLIAGPIVKYRTIQKEIKNRKIELNHIQNGLKMFILGLGKKVLIANNIGLLWNEAEKYGFENISTFFAWIAVTAFALQIYFDFSGYSLMARGLGMMLGFHMPVNFNYPYISKSITEFWRRWHITLGEWFKEYVYFPLGGNRKGSLRTVINLFVVWALTGLWHGAGLNFILWGLLFFILICVEKLWLGNVLNKHRIFSHLYTLFFILLGWSMFAIDDFYNMIIFIKKLFVYSRGTEYIYYLHNYASVLIIAVFFSIPAASKFYFYIKETIGKRYVVTMEILETIVLMSIFIISTAYLVDSTYNPFLYFRF